MKYSIIWYADVGDFYLEQRADRIFISAEGNWPKWYPTKIVNGRKYWAHTSTNQLKDAVKKWVTK